MTNTERNNAIMQHCRFHRRKVNKKGKIYKLFTKFINQLGPYCGNSTKLYDPPKLNLLVCKLRAFVRRGKEELYDKIVLADAQLLADALQGHSTHTLRKAEQPTNLQLLQKIKDLEKQVLLSSPSGHVELSQGQRESLVELQGALRIAIQQTNGFFSPDRLRILRSDLVYLTKREHLFRPVSITQSDPKSGVKHSS